MSTNIEETINRLRELDRVTAPAPWSVNHSDYLETVEDGGMVIEDARGEVIAEADVDLGYNAFFINDALPLMVELRNALPDLLTEIDRLTAENLELKQENHLAWSKGHAAGWDCHIITMQSADLLPKDQKTSHQKGAHHDRS